MFQREKRLKPRTWPKLNGYVAEALTKMVGQHGDFAVILTCEAKRELRQHEKMLNGLQVTNFKFLMH